MLRNREARVLLTALDDAQKEVRTLRKGIRVAQDYCSLSYCERHDNWRISGYIFGCGDQDHES